MGNIHRAYEMLRGAEREACDKMAQGCFDVARRFNLPTDGGDAAERMVEAIAQWMLDSKANHVSPVAYRGEAGADPRATVQRIVSRAQQVAYFEGIGECFYQHEGMRPPRAGEFYLSGAVVQAYRAPNDIMTPYQVVKPTTRAVRQRSTDWPYVAGEPV
jgi:hypothetical protein